MEARFRGFPYRPWLSCIVTKLQRHDQTIVRNCTVVNGSRGQTRLCKDFQVSRGKDFDCVLLLCHNILQIQPPCMQIRYRRSRYRTQLFPKNCQVEVNFNNKFVYPLVRMRITFVSCTHKSFSLRSPSESGVKVKYSDREFSL